MHYVCFLFTICLALSINLSSTLNQTISERPCNIAYKCAVEGDGVWVTDGKKCYVYPNGCLLASANCQRANEYKKKLKTLSKKKCQKRCDRSCTKEYKPVCGVFKGKQKQFKNQCTMDAFICTSGKLFTLYNNGKCQSTNAAKVNAGSNDS